MTAPVTPLLPPATERLRFVLPAAPHAAAMADFYQSPRAAERGWDCLPHEAWRNLATVIGHHALRGFGPFVAEARADGRPVGLFGPWHPEGQPEREIKWTIWPAADEGQGFAAEAARAMLAFAFGPLGWRSAVSLIRPDNLRSIALAGRLGAGEEGRWTTPRGTEVLVFRHVPGGAA